MTRGSRRQWVGLAAVRAFTALVMVGALVAASARVSAAQVDGNTFTAQSFDWSITWDDSVWTDTSETNEEGIDAVTLRSDDAGFVFIAGYGDGAGDTAACVELFEEGLTNRDGVDDVEPSDEFATPSAPSGAEQAVYTYTQELEDGDTFDVAEYVECRVLVDGEAVIQITFQTVALFWDQGLPLFEELLEGLEIDSGQAADDEDEEDVDDEDEDEDVDEEDEDDRDVSLGDEDEDEDTDTDTSADSGIGDAEYESPTYGYAVEWDEDVWEADPGREVVDDGGEDALVLTSVDEIGTLYIEGEPSYDGDPEDCLEGEADLLANEDGVEEFELVEEGESDAGGVFGVYEAVFVNDDGDEFDLVDYVECRELVEGEAVLIITYITSETADFEDNLELVTEVTDTIEVDDRGSTGDDEDEEDATEEPEEEDEATEEPEDEDEETAGGGVDGDTYESPTFGYALSWDDAVWTVDAEDSSGGEDSLILVSDDFGVISFIASDAFAGDAAECYDDLEGQAEDQFADLTILEGDDGEPIRGSDDTGEIGFYGADGDDVLVFLRCSPVADGEGTVAIFFVGSGTEDALDALFALLDELVLS